MPFSRSMGFRGELALVWNRFSNLLGLTKLACHARAPGANGALFGLDLVRYASVTDVEANAFVLDVPGPTPPTLSAGLFRQLEHPVWLPEGGADGSDPGQPKISLHTRLPR